MKTIPNYFALFLSWLTISPLLLILDGRWKLLPKWLRILLFLLSPLMLIALNVVLSLTDIVGKNLFHQYYFIRPKVIEKITGVRFPEYRSIGYDKPGGVYSHGPVQYNTVLEFNEIPGDAFYKALEKHGEYGINEGDTLGTFCFRKPYDYFSISYAYYYDFWTMGVVIVKIKEGSKTFEVTSFEWPDNNEYFKQNEKSLILSEIS